MKMLARLRKLILGETWALPLGVAVALGAAALARALAGPHGWWHHAGGFVLLALLVPVFTLSLAGAWRRR